MENTTTPATNNKVFLPLIFVFIGVVALVITGLTITWYLVNRSDSPITATPLPNGAIDPNYANNLEVPFLKHPALARTSVLYTLKGYIKKIDDNTIVLGSAGPDLTFNLSPTTKYGRGDKEKPLREITKKDITVGAPAWVYPEYNPKLKQLDLLWIVLNDSSSKESTPSGLKR